MSDRPVLHLTPTTGWLNDPHGITYRDGVYHLFHQAVPGSTSWQPQCTWGHATSPDLVTWTRHPTALLPSGETGCWSGCLVPDGPEGPVILYTSVTEPDLDRGAVRAAHPMDDAWLAWRPGEVVLPPPDDDRLVVVRDPFVVREGRWGEGWRMALGAGYADGRAAVLRYRSTDLRSWHPDGVVARSPEPLPPTPSGRAAWECPQLATVGGRDVLLVSVMSGMPGEFGIGWVATALEESGGIGSLHRLTAGSGMYAASVFADAQGRSTVMFWVRGVLGEGWAGALSVPYLLDVVDGPDGARPALAPHPNVLAVAGGAGAREVRWDPSGMARIGTDVELTREPGAVRVRVGGRTERLDHLAGPVWVTVDIGVVEVCTGVQVVALPRDVSGDQAPG